ncbi:ribonuclease HIII [Staphylococcus gallinarum]|uniref:Ribonuclease n=1 Tax=Staphylococcus gallinarum TaxID=1293 RepID=A0A380FF29_STAGA|nr:ribonuclease HIII [Staphylococcus gallinarum]
MSNVVYKLTNPEIQQLMSKINCDTSKLPQGMKAKAKYKNTSISIYNSNKVMFQGKEASAVAGQLLPNHVNTQTASKHKPTQSKINYNQFQCIGSDEAGSGDYFGPLTVCAAYVSKKTCSSFKRTRS